MSSLAAFEARLAMLLREVTPASTFVEFGAEEAELARAMAPRVRSAVAVGRSEPRVEPVPPGFRFLRSEGATIPLAAHSADLVYTGRRAGAAEDRAVWSEIRRVLKTDGRCICVVAATEADRVAVGMRRAGFRDLKLRTPRVKIGLPVGLAKLVGRVAGGDADGEMILVATK